MTSRTNDQIPSVGARVLAFHPIARAWRPATVLGVSPPDTVRVNFMFYAQSENISQFLASDHVVRWPEEVEPLDDPADFLGASDESARGQSWRGMLFSLTLRDPRIYGERRAVRNLDRLPVEAVKSSSVYALLVAAMLDADGRIEGGAALYARLRWLCADFDAIEMSRLTEREIALAQSVMPSPLRARALFGNAKKFVELDAKPGGFRGWLAAQRDPVRALCEAFHRLEPRAAVLFLRYYGSGAIAPDDALRRVAQRLGWVASRHNAGEVRSAYEALARTVGDAPHLVDLTVRRFADTICAEEPQCLRCAVPACPSRREEPEIGLPG